MIPPKGFEMEKYPLRHRILYSFGLSLKDADNNTAMCTLVRHTTDLASGVPANIEVNPHNTAYNEETGPAVVKMSLIDKMNLSLRFNMTPTCATGETGASLWGDAIGHIRFFWRPIFFSFPEKLTATDDDTGTSVATILQLTSDDTNQDVVPITTTKLDVGGSSELPQPVSTVNIAEVFGDYNLTTDTDMEDIAWDEDLFQNALRRFTNKGALKACVGRTRTVNLTQTHPYKSFYLDKFVPRSIRRVVDRTFMAILVHLPLDSEIGSDYSIKANTANSPHIGCKIICNYHEWNADHFQDMAGTGP